MTSYAIDKKRIRRKYRQGKRCDPKQDKWRSRKQLSVLEWLLFWRRNHAYLLSCSSKNPAWTFLPIFAKRLVLLDFLQPYRMRGWGFLACTCSVACFWMFKRASSSHSSGFVKISSFLFPACFAAYLSYIERIFVKRGTQDFRKMIYQAKLFFSLCHKLYDLGETHNSLNYLLNSTNAFW